MCSFSENGERNLSPPVTLDFIINYNNHHQQEFESLLCAHHCTRHWKRSYKRNERPFPQAAYNLETKLAHPETIRKQPPIDQQVFKHRFYQRYYARSWQNETILNCLQRGHVCNHEAIRKYTWVSMVPIADSDERMQWVTTLGWC